MILEWNNSTKIIPKIGLDIIAFNDETWEIELGYRSAEDNHNTQWLDFSFKVTHWAYINPTEISK
jgi:hypothetical protein